MHNASVAELAPRRGDPPDGLDTLGDLRGA
jgi:hypothetical protein